MQQLDRTLALWGDVQVAREIEHTNRASQTWEVVVDGVRAVAKLTFDAEHFVNPGLIVADFVAHQTGIHTGTPIRTLNGAISAEIELGGRRCTMAILTYVEGEPIASFSPESARAVGNQLAAIHRATVRLEPSVVPARSLDWFAQVGDAEVVELAEWLANAPLTMGILYGDPSPELIREASGEIAVIDWGTPSFGPLVYDLATWSEHAALYSDRPGAVRQAVAESYEVEGLLTPADIDALPACVALWKWLTRQ